MLIATLTKALGGAALVGALATTAFLVIPHPESRNGVWLDSPLDNATIFAGPTTLTLHSDLPEVTSIRLVLRKDGKDAASLTDTTLEVIARGKDAQPLSLFEQHWDAVPGIYEVTIFTKTKSAAFALARTTTLTVVDQSPVFVDTATGTSTNPPPTATPIATPTPEPTDTSAPTPEPTSSTPPVATPTPTPSATPPATPPPTVAGFVTRVQTPGNDWSNVYYVTGSSPQSATVVVQVGVRVADSGTAFTYSDVPCSTLVYDTGTGSGVRYKCQTATYAITPVNGPGEFWPTQEIRFRVKLTSNGNTYLSPLTTYTAGTLHAK